MATTFQVISFERGSKTIYRSLLQNFYICNTLRDILTQIYELPAILD